MKLQVFPPQGPPITLPVQLNETIQQVCTRACQQLKLPVGNFYLISCLTRKTLDPLLPVRLSGLPSPQASVQLRQQTVNVVSPVQVALMLMEGERKTGSFASNATIDSILEHFGIEGQVLLGQQTVNHADTIASLGYSKGSCLLRLVKGENSVSEKAARSHETGLREETSGSQETTVREDKNQENAVNWTFRENTQGRLPSAPDLPESHYQLDANELKHYYAMATRRTKQLNDAPLQLVKSRPTSNIPIVVPPTTRLKFTFPDGAHLETNMATSTSLAELHEALGHIIQGAFKLYFNGQLISATNDTTIAQASLWPAVTLQVRWQTETQLGISTKDRLKSTIKDADTGQSTTTQTSAKRVPKWLRLSKK